MSNSFFLRVDISQATIQRILSRVRDSPFKAFFSRLVIGNAIFCSLLSGFAISARLIRWLVPLRFFFCHKLRTVWGYKEWNGIVCFFRTIEVNELSRLILIALDSSVVASFIFVSPLSLSLALLFCSARPTDSTCWLWTTPAFFFILLQFRVKAKLKSEGGLWVSTMSLHIRRMFFFLLFFLILAGHCVSTSFFLLRGSLQIHKYTANINNVFCWSFFILQDVWLGWLVFFFVSIRRISTVHFSVQRRLVDAW